MSRYLVLSLVNLLGTCSSRFATHNDAAHDDMARWEGDHEDRPYHTWTHCAEQAGTVRAILAVALAEQNFASHPFVPHIYGELSAGEKQKETPYKGSSISAASTYRRSSPALRALVGQVALRGDPLTHLSFDEEVVHDRFDAFLQLAPGITVSGELPEQGLLE